MFVDVEGSTPLVRQLGDGDYGRVLDGLQRLLRAAVAGANGHEVECRADEFFAAFQRATDAVSAAVAAQRLIGAHAWPERAQVRVRIGLHTGEPAVEGGVYLGVDVHRAARVCSAGRGGQVLLSQTTGELVADSTELRDLGSYRLAGLARPERIYQLIAPGLQSDLRPLRVEAADERRFRQMRLARSGKRQPTLEEAAWRVRALLPKVDATLQKPLAELGAELLTAHRALTGADGFLTRIDRKRLARQLSAQQEIAFVSKTARQEADSLQKQIDCVERLSERQQALAELAAALPTVLDQTRADAGIAALRGRIATATANLDDAVRQAASTLDPRSYKLERTRNRGVYRSGRLYIVPFVDDLGRERRREFETAAEAHDFRLGLRTAEKAKTAYTGPSHKGFEGGTGGAP